MKATWEKIINTVKRDADEKDYVVDVLTQKDSIDQTCYVYYKDDDQSAVYALNDQHRAQILATIDGANFQLQAKVADMHAALDALVADMFWSEMNEHYRMTV